MCQHRTNQRRMYQEAAKNKKAYKPYCFACIFLFLSCIPIKKYGVVSLGMGFDRLFACSWCGAKRVNVCVCVFNICACTGMPWEARQTDPVLRIQGGQDQVRPATAKTVPMVFLHSGGLGRMHLQERTDGRCCAAELWADLPTCLCLIIFIQKSAGHTDVCGYFSKYKEFPKITEFMMWTYLHSLPSKPIIECWWSYRSLTYPYFKPFPGLKYMVDPDWPKKVC